MSELSEQLKVKLAECAKSIVANGKGILAADESVPTVGKRFAGINLENNEVNRALFREMLFSAPEVDKFFGGIIFFDETLYQSTQAGVKFVDLVRSRGIKVGIKVDKGLVQLPGGGVGEKFTRGLDDLIERTQKYAALGAEFAKWRCVVQISAKETTPSDLSILDVAFTLARYARICQESGIVPIVEPEVLIDGEHDLATAQSVTEKVLKCVYEQLALHKVYLPGTLLKPNMVTPGQACTKPATSEEIALATVTALSKTVPAEVPGVTFLSGGQSEMIATKNLDAINKLSTITKPWRLTFSFARALQNSCVVAWEGKAANLSKAHEILSLRAALNSKASLGQYTESLETDESAKKSLFVAGHTY